MATLSSILGLPSWPANLVPLGLDYMIVESPTAIQFTSAAGLDRVRAGQWQRGVAFGREAELRWVKRQGGWHLVYLSDDGSVLSGAQHRQELAADDNPDGQILLRGRREGKVYLDGRIPGDIEYPFADQIDGDAIPALRTRLYRLRHDGQRLHRLVEPISVARKEAQ